MRRSRCFPRSTARRRASCWRRWCWRGWPKLAAIEPQDRVLDIGCVTGYSTAVLASLGRSVIGLEPGARACQRRSRSFARTRHCQCGHRRGGARRWLAPGRALRRDCLERQCAGSAGEPLRAAERRWQARGHPVGGGESSTPGQGMALRQSGERAQRTATFRCRGKAASGLRPRALLQFLGIPPSAAFWHCCPDPTPAWAFSLIHRKALFVGIAARLSCPMV